MASPRYGDPGGPSWLLPGEGPPTLWTREELLPAVLTDKLLGFSLGGTLSYTQDTQRALSSMNSDMLSESSPVGEFPITLISGKQLLPTV